MEIALSGMLPDRIAESTQPWQWVANLRFSALDPATIRFVDLVGTGADVFDATLNPRLGLVTLAPIGLVDYEAFGRDGRAPLLDLRVRFFFADGTVALSANSYQVAVVDEDDTPPTAISFATGGVVRAGVAGAEIGWLSATDPDTASGFSFSLLPEDEWMFSVEGGLLRLRPGVVLSPEDAPVRPLIVTVSDGRNSSAHVLDIRVDPGLPGHGQLGDVLKPGERDRGFQWSADGLSVRAERGPWEVQAMHGYGDLVQVVLSGARESVWLTRPAATLEFATGSLDFRASAPEFRVWSMYKTIFARDPSPDELAAGARLLEGGFSERTFVEQMVFSAELARRGSFTPESWVVELYRQSVGWELPPGAPAIPWHAGRIVAGPGVVAVTQEIINWAREMPLMQARLAEGLWRPKPGAAEAAALLEVGMDHPMDWAVGWWADALARGQATSRAAAAAIAGTDAFHARFGGLDTASFVRALYRDALHREADEFGLAFWTDWLDTGRVGRADAFWAISTSPEALAPYQAAPPPMDLW